MIDNIVEDCLLHLEETKTFSHSISSFLRWNNELKMLSRDFSENTSNSSNHPYTLLSFRFTMARSASHVTLYSNQCV
jgi:hypothetical protein